MLSQQKIERIPSPYGPCYFQKGDPNNETGKNGMDESRYGTNIDIKQDPIIFGDIENAEDSSSESEQVSVAIISVPSSAA